MGMFGKGKNGKGGMGDMFKNMFGGGKDGEDGEGNDFMQNLMKQMGGKGGKGMDGLFGDHFGEEDMQNDGQYDDDQYLDGQYDEVPNDGVHQGHTHGHAHNEDMGNQDSLNDLFANDPELANLAKKHGYDPSALMGGQGHKGEM